MTSDSVRVAGVVVLFNPAEIVMDNIRSYLNQVEVLYVVDNSDKGNPSLEQKLISLEKVRYMANPGNPGQAHALNRGVTAALAHGAEFVLTMDQDSSAAPDLVAMMLAVLREIPREEIGIIAPFHLTNDRPKPPPAPWQEMFTTMTSGNLLNADAYRRAGPFLEELFLDYVDNEYCLRLRSHGLRIIQVNGALLEHSWGNIIEERFFGKRVIHLNYPPFRWYYIARNFLQVFSTYRQCFPETFRLHCRLVATQAIWALVLEPHRFRKLRMMIRGIHDYRSKRLGKLETPL